MQVIAEYERAVIFRLGRIRPNGPKGPGLFFVIPCLDSLRKVDLRTVTFDVPPQEVQFNSVSIQYTYETLYLNVSEQSPLRGYYLADSTACHADGREDVKPKIITQC